MTKVIDVNAVNGAGNYVAAYILNEAGITAATSGTFVVSLSEPASCLAYASVFLQNVDQTSLIGASAKNSSTDGTNPITTSVAFY